MRLGTGRPPSQRIPAPPAPSSLDPMYLTCMHSRTVSDKDIINVLVTLVPFSREPIDDDLKDNSYNVGLTGKINSLFGKARGKNLSFHWNIMNFKCHRVQLAEFSLFSPSFHCSYVVSTVFIYCKSVLIYFIFVLFCFFIFQT